MSPLEGGQKTVKSIMLINKSTARRSPTQGERTFTAFRL